jgi:hypothetical protein
LADGTRILFSYTTPVALFDPSLAHYLVASGKRTLSTNKHINAWLAKYVAPVDKVPQADINLRVEPL